MADHKFKSEAYNLSCSHNTSYFAAAFMDRSLKVWSLDSIFNNGTKIENPFASVQNAVELGPVDVQVAGSIVGATSMDGSMKLFNINSSTVDLLVDSNTMEVGDAPYDASNIDDNQAASSFELDPWRFCFNPLNNKQFVTG